MSETGIGASVTRKEDYRFLTGKGNYTDDINIYGQTHAYFVRSPHAHATLNSINTSAAAAAPGVVAVFTGDDLAADGIALYGRERVADENHVTGAARVLDRRGVAEQVAVVAVGHLVLHSDVGEYVEGEPAARDRGRRRGASAGGGGGCGARRGGRRGRH